MMPSPRNDDVPRYRNPVIDNDWPDPDAVRVGDDYYLIASSFNRAPGLPILRSRDLIDWERVGHALPAVEPTEWYSLPRHGAGVWAPAIRHHNGEFHIIYPDPEQGILVVSATDPAGTWSRPRLLLGGLGLIDPCPLWDEDGSAYLVHGWARSRSGRKNVLTVVPVDEALTRAVGPAVDVIDGADLDGYDTLEGPKFYRRDGWYWIFAPAGGVATGWQAAFRSRSPYGPYEGRTVLEQGGTAVNGPHQGAWVDAVDGSDWFLHFQDRGVFGRVLHLQPLRWDEDGWPVVGDEGHPVTTWPSPLGATQGARTTTVGDSFEDDRLGSQWNWQANPRADWARVGGGRLELAGPADDGGNLRSLPHVLGQPLPGMPSRTSTELSLAGPTGARAGVAVLGRSYLWTGLRRDDDGVRLVVASRVDGTLEETVLLDERTEQDTVRLVVTVDSSAGVSIELEDGRVLADAFTAVAGHWIGAEIALFAAAPFGGSAARATFAPVEILVDEGVESHA